MVRHVSRRRDGLLEVRRLSWRDVFLTRGVATITGLFLAWGMGTLALMAAMLSPPLLTSVLGATAVPVLWAAGTARCTPASAPAPGRARLRLVARRA